MNLFIFISQPIKLLLLNGHSLIQPVHPHRTGTDTRTRALDLLLLRKRIDLFVVKVLEVLVADLAQLLVPLEQQVVGRRHVVVLVRIYALHCIVLLEVVLYEQLQNFHIDRDLRETDEDTASDFLVGDLVEPGVLPDVRNLKTLLWVGVEDISD